MHIFFRDTVKNLPAPTAQEPPTISLLLSSPIFN